MAHIPVEGSWRMVDGEHESFDTTVLASEDIADNPFSIGQVPLRSPRRPAAGEVNSQDSQNSQKSQDSQDSQETQGYSQSYSQEEDIHTFLRKAEDDDRVLLRSPFQPSLPSSVRQSPLSSAPSNSNSVVRLTRHTSDAELLMPLVDADENAFAGRATAQHDGYRDSHHPWQTFHGATNTGSPLPRNRRRLPKSSSPALEAPGEHIELREMGGPGAEADGDQGRELEARRPRRPWRPRGLGMMLAGAQGLSVFRPICSLWLVLPALIAFALVLFQVKNKDFVAVNKALCSALAWRGDITVPWVFSADDPGDNSVAVCSCSAVHCTMALPTTTPSEPTPRPPTWQQQNALSLAHDAEELMLLQAELASAVHDRVTLVATPQAAKEAWMIPRADTKDIHLTLQMERRSSRAGNATSEDLLEMELALDSYLLACKDVSTEITRQYTRSSTTSPESLALATRRIVTQLERMDQSHGGANGEAQGGHEGREEPHELQGDPLEEKGTALRTRNVKSWLSRVLRATSADSAEPVSKSVVALVEAAYRKHAEALMCRATDRLDETRGLTAALTQVAKHLETLQVAVRARALITNTAEEADKTEKEKAGNQEDHKGDEKKEQGEMKRDDENDSSPGSVRAWLRELVTGENILRRRNRVQAWKAHHMKLEQLRAKHEDMYTYTYITRKTLEHLEQELEMMHNRFKDRLAEAEHDAADPNSEGEGLDIRQHLNILKKGIQDLIF